ncbi:hypothetical protein P9869_39210 [Streptomyces ossamyceticus]|nr:hypothetical protein [Streptomyces ossamyceticus]
MRTHPFLLHTVNSNEDPVATRSEIIRTAPITLVIDDSSALGHKHANEALRSWFDPGGKSAKPTISASEGDEDLPPFDYDDEEGETDPLFVMVNHALWAPLGEGEHEKPVGRHAFPTRTTERASKPDCNVFRTGSDEQQDETEDNEKTLELALSFSVPLTKSRSFREIMREARVVQGLIKLPASEEHAQPTRLLLTTNRSPSRECPVEDPSDGKRRLLDAIVTGCLGGLFVAAHALPSQLLVITGMFFAAHCVRLAVPTRLIEERRPWRLLRRLTQRRRRNAV